MTLGPAHTDPPLVVAALAGLEHSVMRPCSRSPCDRVSRTLFQPVEVLSLASIDDFLNEVNHTDGKHTCGTHDHLSVVIDVVQALDDDRQPRFDQLIE